MSASGLWAICFWWVVLTYFNRSANNHKPEVHIFWSNMEWIHASVNTRYRDHVHRVLSVQKLILMSYNLLTYACLRFHWSIVITRFNFNCNRCCLLTSETLYIPTTFCSLFWQNYQIILNFTRWQDMQRKLLSSLARLLIRHKLYNASSYTDKHLLQTAKNFKRLHQKACMQEHTFLGKNWNFDKHATIFSCRKSCQKYVHFKRPLPTILMSSIFPRINPNCTWVNSSIWSSMFF